jgi:hypothetical protein
MMSIGLRSSHLKIQKKKFKKKSEINCIDRYNHRDIDFKIIKRNYFISSTVLAKKKEEGKKFEKIPNDEDDAKMDRVNVAFFPMNRNLSDDQNEEIRKKWLTWSIPDKQHYKRQVESANVASMVNKEGMAEAIAAGTEPLKKFLERPQGNTKAMMKDKDRENAIKFAQEQWEESQEEGMARSHKILSVKARRMIYELHAKEPDYWTPIRLSNTFKMDSHEMKILLWDMRMEFQADVLGIVQDYSLQLAMERKFGVVQFPDNIQPTPDHIYRKQIKRTFFYIPPEIPSNLLLEHLNKIEAKHYKEGAKIPPRYKPTENTYPPMMVSGQKREFKKKNHSMIIIDTSNDIDVFDNHNIVVRDMDGVLRDPTFNERKDIKTLITHTRHYEPEPYNIWNERGETPTEHTPPPGFTIEFETTQEKEETKRKEIAEDKANRRRRARESADSFTGVIEDRKKISQDEDDM